MRRWLILGLVLLNGLIAAALVATPADSQVVTLGVVDCCKQEQQAAPYCCDSCCWFNYNCDTHEDCLWW